MSFYFLLYATTSPCCTLSNIPIHLSPRLQSHREQARKRRHNTNLHTSRRTRRLSWRTSLRSARTSRSSSSSSRTRRLCGRSGHGRASRVARGHNDHAARRRGRCFAGGCSGRRAGRGGDVGCYKLSKSAIVLNIFALLDFRFAHAHPPIRIAKIQVLLTNFNPSPITNVCQRLHRALRPITTKLRNRLANILLTAHSLHVARVIVRVDGAEKAAGRGGGDEGCQGEEGGCEEG
jgi:hypothetical protein